MKKLNNNELDEISKLAYDTAEQYIFKNINKKDIEDIDITINLNTGEGGLDLNININIDTDIELPPDLSENAVESSVKAIDEYIAKREQDI